eukprot:CAMPEP_0118930628 /NCGR_PEP_ID=MMETSP1169-20130426/7250_1 /TAXON_ID=36882 /ORGANISM="Pyramimonas obovata, Strain CCMP722" /LENGTH=102 /DNA_ID=CAMNT_0006873011 /DNA_START=60 /DNA_END=365 /DNA_ORIENTATION=-
MDELTRLKGVVLVTVAYIVLYYHFVFGQSLTTFYLYFEAKRLKKTDEKVRLGAIKYGARNDKRARCADRTVGNTLEQAVPFLTSLWLYAWFVDAESAMYLGW